MGTLADNWQMSAVQIGFLYVATLPAWLTAGGIGGRAPYVAYAAHAGISLVITAPGRPIVACAFWVARAFRPDSHSIGWRASCRRRRTAVLQLRRGGRAAAARAREQADYMAEMRERAIP